jgi:hypothetical protein
MTLLPSPWIQAKPLWASGCRPSSKTAQRMCDLAATRRTPYVAFSRQSAMYLAHVAFALSFSEIGVAFGRDRTTAAHACRLVEERRDDPAIDTMLGSLETACSALRQRLTAEARS